MTQEEIAAAFTRIFGGLHPTPQDAFRAGVVVGESGKRPASGVQACPGSCEVGLIGDTPDTQRVCPECDGAGGVDVPQSPSSADEPDMWAADLEFRITALVKAAWNVGKVFGKDENATDATVLPVWDVMQHAMASLRSHALTGRAYGVEKNHG
jgi:hypothetical protein